MHITNETSRTLYNLDRPDTGEFRSAIDIQESVPERLETANEITCFVLGAQYAEAGIVGSGGCRDNLDRFWGFYPWEAHAFNLGARSVCGGGEPKAFSIYEAEHYDDSPAAYRKGWDAAPDAPNFYGEENLDGGEFQSDALAFEAGQGARRSYDESFGVVAIRG